MLDGFGQAPVCIELDLDSYDGPWTHVERFRGRSGWLVVAEACLSSATADWPTSVVAACDEYGEPISGFMAPNLLACACSLPEPCDEYPPDELNDLLDEAAEALKRQWLRDTNTSLARLAEAAADHVSALEAQTRLEVDELDHRIADLRRRRRMPGIPDAARDVFHDAIIAFELDRETAVDRLADRRAQMRRAVEEEERAIIGRTAVQVSIDPLYYVSWSAASRPSEERHIARDQARRCAAYVPGSSYDPERVDRAKIDAALRDGVLQLEDGRLSLRPVKPVEPVKPGPQFSCLALADDTPNEPAESAIVTGSPQVDVECAVNGKRRIEIMELRRQLAAAETTGRKFFTGSQKYARNQQQRAFLAERIAELEGRGAQLEQGSNLGDHAVATAAALKTRATPAEDILAQERRSVMHHIAIVEQDRRRFMSGSAAYRRRASQAEVLRARLAEIDERIAATTTQAKAGS